MGLGTRFAAFVIDVIVCITLGVGVVIVLFQGFAMLMSVLPEDLQLPFFLSFMGLLIGLPVLLMVWPIVYFCIPTAIWGRTLGRWICRLRVTAGGQERASIGQALGREVPQIGRDLANDRPAHRRLSDRLR